MLHFLLRLIFVLTSSDQNSFQWPLGTKITVPSPLSYPFDVEFLIHPVKSDKFSIGYQYRTKFLGLGRNSDILGDNEVTFSTELKLSNQF